MTSADSPESRHLHGRPKPIQSWSHHQAEKVDITLTTWTAVLKTRLQGHGHSRKEAARSRVTSGICSFMEDEAGELVRALDRGLDKYRPLTDAGLAKITKKKPKAPKVPHTVSKAPRRSKGVWRDTPTGSRRATFLSLCGSMWRKKGNWGWSLTTRLEWAREDSPPVPRPRRSPVPLSR